MFVMFTAGWHADDTGAIWMTDELLRSQWFVSPGSQSWEMNARRGPGLRRCGEEDKDKSANVGLLWWFCDNRSQYVTMRDTPSLSPQQLAPTCSVRAASFIPAPEYRVRTIFLNTPDISYLWARWINILPPRPRVETRKQSLADIQKCSESLSFWLYRNCFPSLSQDQADSVNCV